MPITRFRVPDVTGYSPSIEGRVDDKTTTITGRNFAFDSKGPKSAFGTRLLALGQVIELEGGIAQSVTVAGLNFVFTTQGVWKLAKDKQSWIKIFDLSTLYDIVNNKSELKWTGAYLSDGVYLCHPKYGFYKVQAGTIVHKDSEDIVGLDDTAMAVAETNGRLIVLGKKFVSWSGPSAAENFVPALGGPGQQRLSDLITGNPVTVSAFQDGFLVWTDKDCMLAEFIAGDNVFRFRRVATEQIPLGAFTVENFPDGSQLICTKQGLYRIVNGNEPEAVTPMFNEFLREVLKHEPGVKIRLTYHWEADHLYVQLRDWTNHYVRTYVLSIALDKWGIFSDRHLGAIRYSATRGSFGYVDSHGTAHRFVDHTFNREVTPHVFEGLDSQIEIGYVKPPEVHDGIDSLLEMHEILLGGRPHRPASNPQTIIDMGELPEPPETTYPWLVYAEFSTTNGFYLINEVEVALEDIWDTGLLLDSMDETGIQFPGPTEGNSPRWSAAAMAAISTGVQAGQGLTILFEYDWEGFEQNNDTYSSDVMMLADDADHMNANYRVHWGISGISINEAPQATLPFSQHNVLAHNRVIVQDFGWLFEDGPSWQNNGLVRVVNTVYHPEGVGEWSNRYSVNGRVGTDFFNPIEEAMTDYWTTMLGGFLGYDPAWGAAFQPKLKKIGILPALTTQVENDVLSAEGVPLSIEFNTIPGVVGTWKVDGEPYAMSSQSATNPIIIKAEPLRFGKIGVPYREVGLQGYGGQPPYTYSVSPLGGDLPDGLEVDSVDNKLTGTPTTDGLFDDIRIRVTDSLGATADAAPFSITIQSAFAYLADERVVLTTVERVAPYQAAIANVQIGAAHESRVIYAVVSNIHTAVFLGGVEMDLITSVENWAPGASTHAIYSLAVAAGESVAGIMQSSAGYPLDPNTIVSFIVGYGLSPAATDTINSGFLGTIGVPEESTLVYADTITIPAGGIAIASAWNKPAGAQNPWNKDVITWTGLDEQSEFFYRLTVPFQSIDGGYPVTSLAMRHAAAEEVNHAVEVELHADLATQVLKELRSVVAASFAPI